MRKHLFTAGTARGGTNFRTLILNNHSKISLSIDPVIPLFRSFRNAILRSSSLGAAASKANPNVLDDYYFDKDLTAILNAIQQTDPHVRFDMAEQEALKTQLAGRMSLASQNLIPFIDELFAPTYKEIFVNAGNIIAGLKKGEDIAWSGFNDNWTVEFFYPLSRLFPDAKFILHLRDPRAVVYSSEYSEPDFKKRPTVISFAKHLRKCYAFAQYLQTRLALNKNFLITYYEEYVSNLETQTKYAVDFLGLEFEPAMLKVESFRKASGAKWESDWKIYQSSVDIWRKDMPTEMQELVEFICYFEMQLCGYQPEIYDLKKGLSSRAMSYGVDNIKACGGWNTDFKEIERTIGCELFRQEIIKKDLAIDAADIQRNFLFPEVFSKIKEMSSSPLSAIRRI